MRRFFERNEQILFAACCTAFLLYLFLGYRTPEVVHTTVRESGISGQLFNQIYAQDTRIAVLEAALAEAMGCRGEVVAIQEALNGRMEGMAKGLMAAVAERPDDYGELSQQVATNRDQLNTLLALGGK